MKSQEREWDLSRLVYLYDQEKDFGELVKFVDSIHDKTRLQTLNDVREMVQKKISIYQEMRRSAVKDNSYESGIRFTAKKIALEDFKSLLDSQIKELDI